MNGKHVLIVEDDYLSNLVLCEFLQENGFRVESAYCAQAALAAIRRRPPCALLTDLDLGGALTGFDVARFARVRDAAMPVIYMSGNVGGRFPDEAVVGSQFIAKPYRPEQILAALRAPIIQPLSRPNSGLTPAPAISGPTRESFAVGDFKPAHPLSARPKQLPDAVGAWPPFGPLVTAPFCFARAS